MALVQVNGTRLWVEDTGGDKPAIVFSHSLFFDSDMFHHQVDAFAGDYRVIRYDHRGQGRSEPATADTLDMDTLTADAAALILALHAGPCHFVGNSLGGFVALRLAAQQPDLLLSATILGSSADAEARTAEFDPLVGQMRSNGTAAVIDSLMFIMFGDTYLANPAVTAERDQWRGKMSRLPASIADSAAAVVHRKPVLAELAGCTVPFLAIAGAEDHAYGAAEARRAAEAAGGTWVDVAQAGHSVSLEQPAIVCEHLRRHFAEAVQAARPGAMVA